jgi:hypothetical protein
MQSRAAGDAPMQAAAARHAVERATPSSAARPPPDDHDALDVLTRDHDHLDALVRELAAGPSDASPIDRRRLAEVARVLDAEITRHEGAERAHLWPSVRAQLDGGAALADEAAAQERELAELVAGLRSRAPDAEGFGAHVERLAGVWHRHLALEDDVLLRLGAVLSTDERADLGERLLAAERPTDGPPG